MYAWIQATALSKKINIKTTLAGKKAATAKPSPNLNLI